MTTTAADQVILDKSGIQELVEFQRSRDEKDGIPVSTIAANNKRLRIKRIFTTKGVHPYDQIVWELRDIKQENFKTGEVIFEQLEVEVPGFWSVNASTIVVTKYFRGTVGEPGRETSIRELIDRVVDTYVAAAAVNGYIHPDDLEIFEHELKYMLVNQYFSFNSPVWFNVGAARREQQVSACFILAVEDTMDGILNWYKEEGLIFKGGSGAGVNLSRLRSSKENLSTGGTASGPVSFMRGADASAGTISSGGATRRAAKMVVLDVDHPDIEQFVDTKAREEGKIRALRAAGYEMDLNGVDSPSVQYQNANNSVRVTDEFMGLVETDGMAPLRARSKPHPGAVIGEVNARELFGKIVQAAWECADPGIQYNDTINAWHTNKETGPITASNPCSEYMSLDNSACNLASLNLLKFLDDDNRFDADLFARSVELVVTAMEISIAFGDFPTEPIRDTTKRYRQLGVGYANLGALLMALGKGYDSDGGRALAGGITSLLTASAYKRSAEIARVVGAYDGYEVNKISHLNVMRMHTEANALILHLDVDSAHVAELAGKIWKQGNALGEKYGYRNAQASVLAPTGTIGFMMDCDTTGVEPDFSLVKFKKLVGGGSMEIVNRTIPRALKKMGYADETIEEIVKFIADKGHVIDAPGLKPEHYEVFDCAMGVRSIQAMGHVRMMAAVQPFISGAISKTVNLPETATVADIAQVYMQGWKLGLKALAVYRDSCKVGQPLSDGTVKQAVAPVVHAGPVRKRLPKRRQAQTTSFEVGGAQGYLTSGTYPEDSALGELFLKFGKQGSTLGGVMDAFSIAISIGLQYGVPLETFVEKFTNLRFEPAGRTDDPDIRMAQSIMDYVFRRLALDYLDFETRSSMGIHTATERERQLETGSYTQDVSETEAEYRQNLDGGFGSSDGHAPVVVASTPAPVEVHSTAELMNRFGYNSDAPFCLICGTKMRPAGSCYVCEDCGATSGCS